MSENKRCDCNYCTAKEMYAKELFERILALMGKEVQEHGQLPSPDMVLGYLHGQATEIVSVVYMGVVEELLDLGVINKEAPQEQEQAMAAEGKVEYDKTKN